MPRFAFKIEYDGAPFNGWQRQAQGQPSVQAAIEEALARLEPGPHTIAAAGRTDTGVHGLGQVAHVDLVKDWDPFRLTEALNHHLRPAPVVILACARVDAADSTNPVALGAGGGSATKRRPHLGHATVLPPGTRSGVRSEAPHAGFGHWYDRGITGTPASMRCLGALARGT